MIVHNIAFRLAEQDPVLKLEQAAEFKRRIESLAGNIPTLNSMTVGLDDGRDPAHYDLVLVSTHDTVADLDAYQAHPLHVALIEYGKTIVSERACVDYEV